MSYTIGVDYGSNSVRAIVVRTNDGTELGTSIFNYPSGTDGIILDPSDHNLARQHPADYLHGLEATITSALDQASQNDPGFSRDAVLGIGVDSTGSSPLPVDRVQYPSRPQTHLRRQPRCLLLALERPHLR